MHVQGYETCIHHSTDQQYIICVVATVGMCMLPEPSIVSRELASCRKASFMQGV